MRRLAPRLRRLFVLVVLGLALIESSPDCEDVLSERSHVLRRVSLMPTGALAVASDGVLSCPPDPCMPGNEVGRDFFEQVVERLSDVPISAFAVDALVLWEPWENTLACWNPLATTWEMEEVCDFNAAGVQSYQNQEMGVQATANTLNLGYYNAIRSMLRLEAFAREALRAALQTWGTCSGAGCDPLLDEWKNLWDSQGGCHCCGKLMSQAQERVGAVQSSALPTLVVVPMHLTSVDEERVQRQDEPPDVMAPQTAVARASAPQKEPPIVSIHAEAAPLRMVPRSAHFQIPRAVFGSGGGLKASAHYTMNGTQGQTTDLSRRVGADYVLSPGYWGGWAPVIYEHDLYLPLAPRSHHQCREGD